MVFCDRIRRSKNTKPLDSYSPRETSKSLDAHDLLGYLLIEMNPMFVHPFSTYRLTLQGKGEDRDLKLLGLTRHIPPAIFVGTERLLRYTDRAIVTTRYINV